MLVHSPALDKRVAVALSAVMAAALAPRPGGTETEVRQVGDRVNVHVTASPVSEVLDRLARETGMKVTYDGPPPRARISLNLSGVTPAQAVLSVLEGQGLNYALRMDPTAKRVETLLMVAGGPGSAATSAPRPPPPGARALEREPEPTSAPEEETPAEAPASDTPSQGRPGFPVIPRPAGIAMPLTLPTPAPPAPGAPSPGPVPKPPEL